MEKSIGAFKALLPSVLRQVSDWFEVSVSIKLFGVEVFSFTWPPVDEHLKNPNHEA